jgi:hypothetical protein
MAEWTKATDLKSAVAQATGGSNPSHSAEKNKDVRENNPYVFIFFNRVFISAASSRTSDKKHRRWMPAVHSYGNKHCYLQQFHHPREKLSCVAYVSSAQQLGAAPNANKPTSHPQLRSAPTPPAPRVIHGSTLNRATFPPSAHPICHSLRCPSVSGSSKKNCNSGLC